MTLIRQMQLDDVDAIRQLDVQAWLPYVSRSGRTETTRTRENVRAALALNPAGCFIAEDNGLIGYIFSRKWGKLGWIGTFGVHPSQQGQGSGRLLLVEATAALAEAGCTTIGLETMPDSPYNVGFYMQCGFRPIYSTVLLAKDVSLSNTRYRFTTLCETMLTTGMHAIAQLSASALPGLDYQLEARNAYEWGWGETLLFGESEYSAFAIVRTQPRRDESDREAAGDIAALVIRPQMRQQLGEVIQTVEAFVAERGLQKLLLAANAADWETLQRLLKYGFRVTRLAQRMIFKGRYDAPLGVDMSRWAM